MKLDIRSIIPRLIHIINVSMSLFESHRFQPTDPTSLLPEGFASKPSIRLGRAKYRYENGTDILDKALLPPVVDTDLGKIEGYHMRVISGRYIYAFEGVPYAEPPVGKYRFRAPVPKKKWDGTLEAKGWKPRCLQVMRGPRSRVIGNEDCLYLNIYTSQLPSKNKSLTPLPVMLFIHGGAFYIGAGTDYGASYLLQQDVVLVTINYRLGVFGFFTDGTAECSGNWGLKDQSEAIQFVHDQIHHFGGDNNKIVLFGQSAGAVSVHLHTMTKQKTKIKSAISMSGTAFNTWGIRPPTEMGTLANRIGMLNKCRPELGTHYMLECLRKVPSVNITTSASLATVMERKIFLPVIEPEFPGAFITKSPRVLYQTGQVAKIPYIFSMTSRELELGLAFRFAGLDRVPIGAIPLAVWPLAPILLDYQGRVKNDFQTTIKVLRHYGGEAYLSQNPEALGQIMTDRHFSHGIRRALAYHSQIAPTYAEFFAYRHFLGFASDLRLNPFEFGSIHGEDVPLLFNRTDRKPVTRYQQVFAVVQLLQNLYTNFAYFGEPLFTSSDYKEDLKIWNPVDPKSRTVEFLQVDKDVKMIRVPSFENATNFWNSLNITDL